MNSAAVPFYEIVENVKDETGIENISPLLEKLKRFVFNAEKDIGYGGTVVLKKMVFNKGFGFDGKYFKFPTDYMEFEGVGNECGQLPSCEYGFTPAGIRLAKNQQKIVFLYWGLICDGYGYPITTRNHQKAVVAYCVWKLYAVRRFIDKGNANTAYDYEMRFERLAEASRGDDAWPTMEQWNQLSMLSYADRRGLLQIPYIPYDYSSEFIPEDCHHEIPQSGQQRVYFWQVGNEDIIDIAGMMSEEYLSNKESYPLTVFENGVVVHFYGTGNACFAIKGVQEVDFIIVDAINNDITSNFEMIYLDDLECVLFVSSSAYDQISVYFEIKQQ